MDEQAYNDLYGIDAENEQPNEQGDNKKYFGKKKRRASARIRNYLNYLTCNTRNRVRSIINNESSKESCDKSSNSHEKTNGSQSGTKDSEKRESIKSENSGTNEKPESDSNRETNESGDIKSDKRYNTSSSKGSEGNNTNSDITERCDPCDESGFFNVFKNLREKLSFSTD